MHDDLNLKSSAYKSFQFNSPHKGQGLALIYRTQFNMLRPFIHLQTQHVQLARLDQNPQCKLYLINAYIPPWTKYQERKKATADIKRVYEFLSMKHKQFSCFLYMDANTDLRGQQLRNVQSRQALYDMIEKYDLRLSYD